MRRETRSGLVRSLNCFEDIEVPSEDSVEVDLEIPEIDLKIEENEFSVSGIEF